MGFQVRCSRRVNDLAAPALNRIRDGLKKNCAKNTLNLNRLFTSMEFSYFLVFSIGKGF
jgi:hypothetical protein